MTEYLQKFAQFFPIIALLGPRQSGKTTLAQEVFKDYHYINLENLGLQEAAFADPQGFLEKLLEHQGVIIDEFQQVPRLLSYLQIIVDREKKPGFFILTGSHNFLMNQSISQSLAGRVGILTLLPLSNKEIVDAQLQAKFSEEAVVKGCYPRLFGGKTLGPQYVYPSYIQTYLERDVRSIVNVTDLSLFKKFLGLCAGRVGQLVNVSALASDCGISMQTVKSWLSILEASYIIFLLQPYHKNFNKRLVKSSKLYFYDTGIACSLLGIDSAQQLELHYMRGQLFE
ncbi:ATP-binding protein, partial [Candidatus Dependentiae bacterium]|nr:ATP-binding protein [Candidatus Dependentiae bacterium]